MSPLLECVPNFSEGRRPEVVEAIGGAMAHVRGVRILDLSTDPSHNRSVFTLAGEPGDLVEGIRAGAGVALLCIDLNHHEGVHPRIGALDVCPFVPLEGAGMDLAVETAKRAAGRLGRELGLPCFLYGEAAEREDRRDLHRLRKGQFEGLLKRMGSDPAWAPDRGPSRIHPTGGASAVGARFFLLAFNVHLASEDLDLAKKIAQRIRERDGGLPGVKALGLPLAHLGIVQVSMNLVDYRVTGVRRVFDEIGKLAREEGVEVRGSELVGLAPAEALDRETASHVRLMGFDPSKDTGLPWTLEERLTGGS